MALNPKRYSSNLKQIQRMLRHVMNENPYGFDYGCRKFSRGDYDSGHLECFDIDMIIQEYPLGHVWVVNTNTVIKNGKEITNKEHNPSFKNFNDARKFYREEVFKKMEQGFKEDKIDSFINFNTGNFYLSL